MLVGLPGDGPGGTGNGTLDRLLRGAGVFGRQREATIFVVAAALLLYFGCQRSPPRSSSSPSARCCC
jgi:hypothetical protein